MAKPSAKRTAEPARVRTWSAGRPVPMAAILAPLRRGSGDPTYVVTGGRIWRSMRTPCGPAVLALGSVVDDGAVHAEAWGAGAEWALDQMPRMLGADDDIDGFRPSEALSETWRHHGHLRIGATGLVFEALVPAVLEQKVTGHEAWYAWRRLVREHGEPAPGDGAAVGLYVPPGPDVVRRIPSWKWRQLSVDEARSSTIVHAACRADAVERTLQKSSADAERALRSLPGIGVWTAAEIRQRAHGDRDAVSFGDYHLSGRMGRLLLGYPIDDAAMAELLEAYRPQRYRMQRLVELRAGYPERHRPRMPARRHLPTRSR